MAEERADILTLSWGARVRVEPVSQFAVQMAQENAAPIAERPQPPTRTARAFGEAEEQLPFARESDLKGLEDDPQYPAWLTALREWRAALIAWANARTEAGARLMLMQSVHPLDDAGNDLPAKEMAAVLDDLGFEVPARAAPVRAAYLRFHALRTGSDWTAVMGRVGELTAVSPEEVQTAVAGFLNRNKRGTAEPDSATGGAENVGGDDVSRNGSDATGRADEPVAR